MVTHRTSGAMQQTDEMKTKQRVIVFSSNKTRTAETVHLANTQKMHKQTITVGSSAVFSEI